MVDSIVDYDAIGQIVSDALQKNKVESDSGNAHTNTDTADRAKGISAARMVKFQRIVFVLALIVIFYLRYFSPNQQL